jgi:exopolysaccharide biosynthesis polyprenyl glycosylphosphotransferase
MAAADLSALGLAGALIAPPPVPATVFVAFVLLSLAFSGAYRVKLNLSGLEQVPALITRLGAPLFGLVVFAAVTGVDTRLFQLAVAAPVALVTGRILACAAVRALRRRGHLLERAVIVGGGEIASQLATVLRDEREFGLIPVGYLDPDTWDLSVPRLGDIDDLERVLAEHQAARILVAYSHAREQDMVELLRRVVRNGVEVHVVPRFFDIGIGPGFEGVERDEIWGLPLYRVLPVASRRPTWHLKRAFDVAAAGAGLLVLAPVLLAAAAAVRLTSPGPVMFRQRRVGQDGHEFEMLKFRTLYQDHSSHTTWTTVNDASQTPVGRFLRRTNIDELPQLLNILRGDMSVIGPRPERTYFVRQFWDSVPGYASRHRLPGGLSGWAQVNGLRGDDRIAERARFDNNYIENWSLWRDLVIMLRSVKTVIKS